MNRLRLRSAESFFAVILVALILGEVDAQQLSAWRPPPAPTAIFDPWDVQPHDSIDFETIVRGQDSGGEGGGGGDLAGDATNPTSNLTQYQLQNTFIPSTYEASGFAHTLSLQLVKPFETGHCFFPTWITRTTLPVVTTADPDGAVPIGPPNDSDFLVPLGQPVWAERSCLHQHSQPSHRLGFVGNRARLCGPNRHTSRIG